MGFWVFFWKFSWVSCSSGAKGRNPHQKKDSSPDIDISQKCSQTTTGGHTAPTLKCSPQPGLSFGHRVAMVIPKQSLV